MIMNGMKASLTMSIKDSMRQRGLTAEAAAAVAGIEPERMRALVQQHAYRSFAAEDLMDVLDAIDASGPRYGRRP